MLFQEELPLLRFVEFEDFLCKDWSGVVVVLLGGVLPPSSIDAVTLSPLISPFISMTVSPSLLSFFSSSSPVRASTPFSAMLCGLGLMSPFSSNIMTVSDRL